MGQQQPPRLFRVNDVLSGRADVAASPYRHICLTEAAAAISLNSRLDRMFSAIEMLESHGWALVNVEHDGSLAYLRRLG